jgi:hypothetical protein
MGHILYIDPGTGTILFQMIIAGVVTLISFSRRVKSFAIKIFTRLFRKE